MKLCVMIVMIRLQTVGKPCKEITSHFATVLCGVILQSCEPFRCSWMYELGHVNVL